MVYASALRGFAGLDSTVRDGDMQPLFKTIVEHCPPPDVDVDGPLQLQVTLLDYSSYVGAIGIGRIKRGTLRRGMAVTVVDRDGNQRAERITQILGFHGLTRVEVESAGAGDIVAFAGIAEPKVSDTLCDPATVEPLPSLTVDEPTISMTFEVNTSPFLGPRGQVRHQPPDPRAPGARVDPQRGAARRADRGPGQVRGLRPRRIAPRRAPREHAPRGL